MIDFMKKYWTRAGQEVRDLRNHSVAGLIEGEVRRANGEWERRPWFSEGRCSSAAGSLSGDDLIEVPVEHPTLQQFEALQKSVAELQQGVFKNHDCAMRCNHDLSLRLNELRECRDRDRSTIRTLQDAFLKLQDRVTELQGRADRLETAAQIAALAPTRPVAPCVLQAPKWVLRPDSAATWYDPQQFVPSNGERVLVEYDAAPRPNAPLKRYASVMMYLAGEWCWQNGKEVDSRSYAQIFKPLRWRYVEGL